MADCLQALDECVAVGRWNFSMWVGAGVTTNPLLRERDIPVVVIPQVTYYGRRFFIDNLDLGVTLTEAATSSLSLIASPGYDRLFFYRGDLQNIFLGGLPGGGGSTGVAGGANGGNAQFPPRARRVTYLAGPEWTFQYRGVTGQFDFLHEITGQNGGDEIRAALAIPLLQTSGYFGVSIGATWKSAAIVDYYYGAPNIYAPGSALNPFLKFKYTRPLSRHWRFDTFVQYERLGSAIAHSPIVAEDFVATAFIGAVYAL